MDASFGSKACLLVIQEAQYIPGPWLKEGKNELIFLEVEKSPSEAAGMISYTAQSALGTRSQQY